MAQSTTPKCDEEAYTTQSLAQSPLRIEKNSGSIRHGSSNDKDSKISIQTTTTTGAAVVGHARIHEASRALLNLAVRFRIEFELHLH